MEQILSLTFQLAVEEGEELLKPATLEARRLRNEITRLHYEGWNWSDIEDAVIGKADLVNNTCQQILDKAHQELDNYYEADDQDWGAPSPIIHRPYAVKMNHGEGYRITEDNGEHRFRISTKPYNHVKGVLKGSPDHHDLLTTALNNPAWRVGTAELLQHRGEWELHVTVTNTAADVRSPAESNTVVGVDINEDCVALAAMNREDGDMIDSLVLDYPDIKRRRHEYFTKRKRMQKAGQTAFETVVQQEERDFVHDQLHKVSRDVVRWVSQFENPVIVFEDLKDMRDGLDYGTRMNRRLHSLPFRKLRRLVTYKAARDGVPSVDVDPEYTSQRCPRTTCLHVERGNRRGKRFKCKRCEFQDHADRKAAVCVCQEWFTTTDENVPSLNTLPRVWKVRRTASGLGEGADSHGHVLCSGVTDRGGRRDPVGGAREELNSVAPGSG
ncbi:IS605 OrfB family transposase [Natrinema hispanicum]|uniref:IS605 OrfB family transposase n=1 Tax=Natrinema hispanicum TaxID=392421 RepID=A0A482Y846_9EURY|nr:RNA-guided endonuclease TnpB family protein [Natrinema hispanicum]RZV10696.1 IS605 OrfB family transposase [Natrinema hispanicum]